MDPAVYRVINPCWMGNPDDWVWLRPDGQLQGFGIGWREDPGLANLCWLAMGMNEPPRHYDATQNALYMWVLSQVQLRSCAALLSLKAFAMLDFDHPNALELQQRAARRTHVYH